VTYRELGRAGLKVSAVAFGAGPVSGLMTGSDFAAQLAAVRRAIEVGINWFDTAPGYGVGRSEANLGRVLAELGAADRAHVATKVRVPPEFSGNAAGYVLQSAKESLKRLGLQRVTLLQLHNGITTNRGDEAAGLPPSDILGDVLLGLRLARDAFGLTEYIGLTGTGHPGAMREVAQSGAFDTIQVPFNALNPSAGYPGGADGEADFGNVMADCAAQQMGVFAIRTFAGGALLDQPPSAHTLKTPYFPLPLYERDLERARRLRERVAGRMPMGELAVRFALSHPAVSSAIVGFGAPEHVDEVARLPLDEPLPADLLPPFGPS
jgi:aryl-alcohol dehydrogenase-like predicted oxidoreductase